MTGSLQPVAVFVVVFVVFKVVQVEASEEAPATGAFEAASARDAGRA